MRREGAGTIDGKCAETIVMIIISAYRASRFSEAALLSLIDFAISAQSTIISSPIAKGTHDGTFY
jgi:hypothetical protein